MSHIPVLHLALHRFTATIFVFVGMFLIALAREREYKAYLAKDSEKPLLIGVDRAPIGRPSLLRYAWLLPIAMGVGLLAILINVWAYTPQNPPAVFVPPIAPEEAYVTPERDSPPTIMKNNRPTTIVSAPYGYAITGGTVVNPSINVSGPPPAQLSWRVDNSPLIPLGNVTVELYLDRIPSPLVFAARCDRPCHSDGIAYKQVNTTYFGDSKGFHGPDKNVAAVLILSPINAGQKLDWGIEANDGKGPLHIQEVQVLSEEQAREIMPDLRGN